MLSQKEEAESLESETYAALVATPERGADFAAAVRSVLADETHWVAWKRDPAPDPAGRTMPCTSFQRAPYQEPASLQKGRGKRPGGEPALQRSIWLLGSKELLFDCTALGCFVYHGQWGKRV